MVGGEFRQQSIWRCSWLRCVAIMFVIVAQPATQAYCGEISNLAQSGAEDDFIGYATMGADGVLHVRVQTSADNPELMSYDLRPSNPDYERVRDQADGVQPRQTRRLRRVLALVGMRDDRTVIVSYFAGPHDSPTGATPGIPRPTIILPDDARYEDLIQRAGGLNPGQSKQILAGTPAAARWNQ